MARFQLKKGLGTARKRTIQVWHVVKDGRTVASLTTRDDAISYIRSRYGDDALRQALQNEK